jgi:hypothetical protein
MIYLVGNLREANGPLAYGIADFLYGPLKAACFFLSVYALRELIGERAPRRMSIALLASALTALVFVTAALLRSANRGYHLDYPELHLENSQTVLIVWTTLLAGVVATAWHFLGWTWLLVAWAGWTSRRLPRILCALYFFVGVQALFVYLRRDTDLGLVPVGALVCVWQGIVLLLRAANGVTVTPKVAVT